MGKLVRLSNYRRERQRLQLPAAEPPSPATEHPYYYCTRCQGEKFTLGPDGEVQCAGCGALMRNLAVHDDKQPK